MPTFEGSKTKEQYYFGQGKVYVRIKSSNERWYWIGDVSNLALSAQDGNEVKHEESYSGKKQTVRKISFGGDMTLAATIHQIDAKNLALATRGTISNIEAATIAGENIGTIKEGDVFMLENGFNVSELKLMAGSTEIEAKHYELDAIGGVLSILSVPTPAPTDPITVNYKHEGAEGVVLFNGDDKELELRFVGKNMAENGRPVIFELYKIKPGNLESFGVITDPGAFANMPWTCDVLADTTKPANGELGQVGRFLQANWAK